MGLQGNFDASHLSVEEKIEAFRAAMHGVMDASREHGDVTPEGAAAFYMTAVVAVRQLFGGEHPDHAIQDEARREMRRVGPGSHYPWMNPN